MYYFRKNHKVYSLVFTLILLLVGINSQDGLTSPSLIEAMEVRNLTHESTGLSTTTIEEIKSATDSQTSEELPPPPDPPTTQPDESTTEETTTKEQTTAETTEITQETTEFTRETSESTQETTELLPVETSQQPGHSTTEEETTTRQIIRPRPQPRGSRSDQPRSAATLNLSFEQEFYYYSKLILSTHRSYLKAVLPESLVEVSISGVDYLLQRILLY